jgi:NAD(P)-dependent dehydrogenase (short-subunit alcohol dehydrogenase family)
MNQLKGKVAIVTGASAGIGRAAAKLFAEEGAKVVVCARRSSELKSLVDEIKTSGGEAVAHAGDVANEETARKLVELAVGTFGKLDVSFNNAGVMGETGPTTEVTRKGWDETLAINLTSAFLAAKHQIPAMLKAGAGSVIFTQTFLGHTASFPGVAAYASSKAGLIGLTQTLAVEFGSKNIRVNSLLPGAVDTDMYRLANSTPEAQSFVTGLHALKRVGRAEELAKSALYLASDASAFQTGTAMIVDGGASVNRT